MLRLNVEGMNCNHCVRSVTDAVKSVDPKAEVHVDLAAKRVEADTEADAKAVTRAITAAGYTVVAA
jgi:copper chaperone